LTAGNGTERHEFADPVSGVKLVTLFMIVTERDHLIADYAIRSFGKVYRSSDPRAKSFTLFVYLNCLRAETISRFLPRWSNLPWVHTFDNRYKAAQLNLEKGGTIVSPEGIPRVRDDANENHDELWSSELLNFETRYVGTVDADFEVLAPDFFFAALDELERDAAVAGCSTDHSDTAEVFDRYSDEAICMHERWHTWFCLYRRRALASARVSHFYYERPLSSGMRYVYDSGAYLQSRLIERYGLRFVSLPRVYQRSFIHYGAFTKLKRTDPRRIRRIRRVSLLTSKGLIYGAAFNRYSVFSLFNQGVKLFSRTFWGGSIERWREEKATFDPGVPGTPGPLDTTRSTLG
jgi:hypothetical protein